MAAFQTVQFLFIVIVSLKLRKQLSHHTATNWFLIQTYLSTILVFAGIYTVIERCSAGAFQGVFESGTIMQHERVFIRFLYCKGAGCHCF